MELLNQPIEESFLTKVDSRFKMLYGLLLIISVYSIQHLGALGMVVVFAITTYIIVYSTIGLVRFLWSLKFYFLLFILFTFLLSSQFSSSLALRIVIKFTILLISFSAISKSTNPDEITDSLIRMRIPSSMAWTIGTTLRQFYFISGEVDTIYKLYSSDPKYGDSLREKLGMISKMIIGIYANAISRANQLALSLEARNYRKPHREIVTYQNSLSLHDLIFVIIFILPLVGVLTLGSQVFM